MTRLVVADDQDVVRVGLTRILDGEPDLDVVGEAADGEAALREVRRTRPDVVLMDIRMPVLDGLSATRRILEEQPDLRVLVLTTFDLDEYVYEALRSGAAGFVLKDSPAGDLVRAVRVGLTRILDGEPDLDVVGHHQAGHACSSIGSTTCSRNPSSVCSVLTLPPNAATRSAMARRP